MSKQRVKQVICNKITEYLLNCKINVFCQGVFQDGKRKFEGVTIRKSNGG